MRIRYKGDYTGFVDGIQGIVKPGDVVDVSVEVAEKLLTTAQFEKVRQKPEPAGGE